MNDKLKNCMDDRFERKFGMTYDEFEHLSFDEQQRIVESNRIKRTKAKDIASAIVGYEENSMVTDVKKTMKL